MNQILSPITQMHAEIAALDFTLGKVIAVNAHHSTKVGDAVSRVSWQVAVISAVGTENSHDKKL